jgi:signal-transduction protein with cAMP-binding, CBS, and nucleotidyltransferase domain
MADDHSTLARLDSFLYRHRLAQVMSSPVLTAAVDATVATACKIMSAHQAGSLVVIDDGGWAVGLVTERHILAALADTGADALSCRVARIMTPVIPQAGGDAFLYVAVARMARHGLKHLLVVDADGRPAGIVSARDLMKGRAAAALSIGDDVAMAATSQDLGAARALLPGLATSLLADGVPARDCAGVISSVLRDLSRRSGELARDTMAADGWGPPPAPFSLLILGSAGRGESLLAFDQDNAIVHAGGLREDVWFEEFARRVNQTLDEAGVPFCEGDVMARNRSWRRSLDDWKLEIRRWVFEPKMQSVLNVDIFFDFQPVFGDAALAEDLKSYALDIASSSAFFVQFLAITVAQMEVPLGLFGEFITTHGRLNAKKYGLLPIVAAARARAVKAGIRDTGTGERFDALARAGLLHRDDAASLKESHEIILGVMLSQQLADIAQGSPPSARIDPRALPRMRQRGLKAAFKRIRTLKTLMGNL